MIAHVILGMGCRDACALATLHTLALDTLAVLPDNAVLHAIACWVPRQQHPALNALATILHVPLHAHTTDALAYFTPQLTHYSEALYQRTGLWGVAEAAALAEADKRNGLSYEGLSNTQLNKKRLHHMWLNYRHPRHKPLSLNRMDPAGLSKGLLLVPRRVAPAGMATAALAAFTPVC